MIKKTILNLVVYSILLLTSCLIFSQPNENILNKIDTLKATIQKDPKDIESIITLAELYIDNNTYSLAGEEMKKLHKIKDTLSTAHKFRYYRAMARYFSTQKMKVALTYFDKAIKLQKDINLLIEKGNFLFSTNKYNGALNSYESCLELASSSTNINVLHDIHYYIGCSLMRLEKYSDAKKSFEKALTYNNSFKALSGIGSYYFHLNDLDQSEKYLNQAISLAKENNDTEFISGLYMLLSKISEKRNLFEKNKISIELAIKLDPENVYNKIKLANLTRKYSTKEKALDLYNSISIDIETLLNSTLSKSEKAAYINFKLNATIESKNYSESIQLIKILISNFSYTEEVLKETLKIIISNLPSLIKEIGDEEFYNMIVLTKSNVYLKYAVTYKTSEYFLINKNFSLTKKFAEVCFLKYNHWSKKYTPPAIYRVNDAITDDNEFIIYCENILKDNKLDLNIKCRLSDILAHRYIKMNNFEKALSLWDFILNNAKDEMILKIAKKALNKYSK